MNDVIRTLRAAMDIARDSELSFLAGSIAFFAFFSLIPALLLTVAVGSVFGGERFALGIVSLIEAYLSDEGSAVVSEALTDPSGVIGASIVGVVALIWSTLKVFRSIDIAFDRIYRADGGVSLPQQLVRATVVVVAIGLGFALLITVRSAIVRLEIGGSAYAGIVGVPVLLAGLFVVLVPLYYVMPPRRVSAYAVVPGTLTAVGGLIVLQQVFHVYAAYAGQYRAYGFIGVVLLFLLWLYFGSVILLSGAVVNAAIEQHR